MSRAYFGVFFAADYNRLDVAPGEAAESISDAERFINAVAAWIDQHP